MNTDWLERERIEVVGENRTPDFEPWHVCHFEKMTVRHVPQCQPAVFCVLLPVRKCKQEKKTTTL